MFVDIIFRLCALISHYPYDPKLSPASDFLAALNCGLFFVTMRSSAPPGVHSFSVMRPLSILGWRRTLAAHGETSSREAARKQNFSSSYGTSPPLSCLWSPHCEVAPVAGFSADGKRTGVLVRAGSRDMRSKTDKLLPRGKYP